MANRLKSCIEVLISPNQTVFVPHRNIAENVLLAQEIVKDYHKEKGKARYTLKVDIMKAYDSLNWEFIPYSLTVVGMLDKFVNWVRQCITNPSYSISINASLAGFFKGKKGLR